MMVCLGDSITASGWPAILQELLLQRGWSGVRCLNAGVRGNTSTQGLRRLDRDVLVHHPSLVMVQFGFNDCNVILNGPRPRTMPEDFRHNLFAIVERVRAAGAGVMLVANHRTLIRKVLPDGRTYEEHSQDYNQIIREVALAAGIPIIDMAQRFPGDTLPLPAALDADGIHLNSIGIKRYAEVVAEALGVSESDPSSK